MTASPRDPGDARVGPYEVLGPLGRGGAGVVLRARSADGREVAVKLLRSMSPAALLRFARERSLQAQLGLAEGFVPLIDAGAGPSGPWLAMPIVPGGTLRDRLLRGGALPIGEAIDLVRRLAEALARAHARGIVHRDLKPENILFTADGVPLVADLGLAKRDGEGPPGMSLSATGEFRGTIGYMAPEQMKDAKSVGPAADVFALGAILYECVSGRPAFTGDTIVLVIARLSAGLLEPLATLRPDTPDWLARLVEDCLSRDPARRPRDAAALAAALVAAPAEEARVRLRRAARLRGVVAGAAAGALAGVALGAAALGPIVGRWSGSPAPAAPTPPTPGAPAPVADVAPPPAPVADVAPPPAVVAEVAPPPAVDRASTGGPPLGTAPLDLDLRAGAGVEVVARWGAPAVRHAAGVGAIAVAPGLDLVASADDAGALRLWRMADGARRDTPLTLPAGVETLALSGDGEHVAYVTSGGQVTLRALGGGGEGGPFDAQGSAALAVGLARSASTAVISFSDGRLLIWDATTWRARAALDYETPLTAIAVAPDGETCVVGTARGELAAFDPRVVGGRDPTAGAIRTGHDLPVRRLAVSADKRRAAALLPGAGLVVWELGSPNFAVARGALLAGEALDLAFTPDGNTVVGVDATEVAAYDCARRTTAWRQPLPRPARAAAALPTEDGRARVLYSDARDGRLEWLDAGPTGVERRPGHAGRVVAMVARGATLVSAGADGSVLRWTGPDQAARLLARDGALTDVALAPDGQRLAAVWSDPAQGRGGLVVLDLERGAVVFTREGARPASTVTLSADGQRAFVGEPGGLVLPTWIGPPRGDDDLPAEAWQAGAGALRRVRRLGDGRLVTSGSAGLAVWPALGGPSGGRLIERVPAHGALAVAPDRPGVLLLGCEDGSLVWLDVATGQQPTRLAGGHTDAVTAVAISPDGDRVASAGADRTLCLWDLRGEEARVEALRLDRSEDLVTALSFDGLGLLIGFESGVVVRLRLRPV
ncbi:MAG: serine/threonine-protein kinase [Planctomycetes bacterium]|nr:serine/threonine-protein kinase [Planctomycetota bacterium]